MSVSRKEESAVSEGSFPIPYYPHHHHTAPSSEHNAACLRAIIDGYHRKDTKSPEEPPSLSNTPSFTNSSQSHLNPTPALVPALTHSPVSGATAGTARRKEKLPAPIPGSLDNPRKTGKMKTSSSSSSKNHLVRKPAHSQSSQNKNLLPSLLKSKAKVTNKKAAVNKRTTTVKRLGMTAKAQHVQGKSVGKSLLRKMHSHSIGQYLTRLPPKLPYQTLLSALEQASKENTAINTTSTTTPYTPPSDQHTHSVFHDHFALLSNEHIPTEFSLPITSLLIKLPREVYESCLRAKIVRQEHSYSKTSDESTQLRLHQQQHYQQHHQQQQQQWELSSAELKLSVPRSLIRTKESCECDGRALVFCSRCHSLYHTVCVGAEGTLCPNCVTILSLLASS